MEVVSDPLALFADPAPYAGRALPAGWAYCEDFIGGDEEVRLAPRSAYVLRRQARWGWQHGVAPTPALRYSSTLRTAARRSARRGAGG